MENNTVLEMNNLKINIQMDEGLLTPVRGVSFAINENETLGLVGESGCGKSLTCKAILGINGKKCKTDGEILFRGEGGKEKNLLKLRRGGKELRGICGKEISMIFQEPMTAFSPLFTIGHQMSEGVLLHQSKTKQEAKKLVIEMMERVGIADAPKRFSQYPHEFSGGMLQRALIAGALINNPRVLIADEPTTALDVTIQAQILELLKELQRDFGMAILYITHDLGTVAQMCDRVAVMYLGRIVETGKTEEIFKNPHHPYTQGLIGSVHKIGSKKERLFSIEGSVPLAMNLEDRCGFYERCASRVEACEGAEPILKAITAGHSSACCRPWSNDGSEVTFA